MKKLVVMMRCCCLREQTGDKNSEKTILEAQSTKQGNVSGLSPTNEPSSLQNDQSSQGYAFDSSSLRNSIIPDSTIDSAPLLTLTVEEGMIIDVKKIEINAGGCIGSKRNARDGCVYFGACDNSPDIPNDVLLSKEELGIGKVHMVIKYYTDASAYYIKDLGDGTGTFIRLDKPVALKHGFIISFGDSHMVVNLPNSERSEESARGDLQSRSSELTLKFLDGPKADTSITFDKQSSPIRVGRMVDCAIRFDDSSLSRYQCIIIYQEGEWVLYDGNGKKLSTNGTWLFADEFFKIYDGMIFKIGQTLFRTRLNYKDRV